MDAEKTPDFKLIAHRKNQFLNEVSSFLEPGNLEGSALLGSIEQSLRACDIRDVEPKDILLSAVVDGVEYLGSGKEDIRNKKAWIRKVCLHKIADEVRRRKRARSLKKKSESHVYEDEEPLEVLELDEMREDVKKAMQLLPKADREILELKYYGGKTYQEMQELFLARYGTKIHLPTLRKRESRAVQRLRKILLSK